MDIDNKVTVSYQMKRGNYAVDSNDRIEYVDSDINTSVSRVSSSNNRESSLDLGQRGSFGASDKHGNKGQTRGCLCEEDCVQREPLQHRLVQQIEWCSWSMAVTLGKARVVTTQTNIRSTRVCASSVRNLVQGVRVPSGKELVLSEST
jgi:hypothetical protein